MSYPAEEEFVKAVVEWIEKPALENSRMPGAVKNYNTMPKLGYSKKDVEEIASYIYRTNFAQPVIPDSIRMFHGNRQGRGKGMGMGYGRKNGGRGRGGAWKKGGMGACAPGYLNRSTEQISSPDTLK